MTNEITKERRDAIRAAAEKATPGQWELEEIENRDDRGRFTSYGVSATPPWSPDRPKSVVDTLNSGVMEIVTQHNQDGSSSWDAQGERDCTHIANCDPQTILALLDALDAAEAKLATGEPVAAEPHSLLWEAERIAGDLLTCGSATKRRDAETIRRMIDLLATPPAAEPVRVKPLEWDELTSPREDGPREPTGDWEANSIIGSYHVYIFEDHYEVTRGDGDYVENWCGDAQEAKAAAQADYEARIRSALVSEKEAE